MGKRRRAPGGRGGGREGGGGAAEGQHDGPPTNGIEQGATVLDTHRRLIAVDATGARVAVAAGPSVRAVDLRTGAALITDDGATARAHGGAHVTAVAWVAAGAPEAVASAAAPAAAASSSSPPPPRLLTGGLDKAVRLWAPQASEASGPLQPRACWRAHKKVSAVALVPAATAHVFFADRYGDVLSAPLPPSGATAAAATAAEGDAAAAPAPSQQQHQHQQTEAAPVPSNFALGHLSSGVSRALAVPASDDEGNGGDDSDAPTAAGSAATAASGRRSRPLLLATSDADGKVRLSRVPADAGALARHGLPEVHAYAMGHRSAVVDLALLRVPRRWLGRRREAEAEEEEGAEAAATNTATTSVLVSGGADGTVRLWCPDTGAELCRATVSAESEQEAEADEGEQEQGEEEGGDGDGDGGDSDDAADAAADDDDEAAAAARQALERMQRLEAALAPGDDACLRDPRCPSVTAVAAIAGDGRQGRQGQEGQAGGRPPLVAVAVEGEHAVCVFAVERLEPEAGVKRGQQQTAPPLRLSLLRRSPVPGVRFPTSLQFAPALPAAAAAAAVGAADAALAAAAAAAAAAPAAEPSPPLLLLWAAGGMPSAALITGAPVLPPTSAAAAAGDGADVSADVGAADALTGADAAPALVLGALEALMGPKAAAAAATTAGPTAAGDDKAAAPEPPPPPLPPYPVPLLWRRREAERRRHGRQHGAHLKRGRTDFAETARLARLHPQQ